MMDDKTFLNRLSQTIKEQQLAVTGAVAFLGKSLGHNGILMLGLNPGGDCDEFKCELATCNCLLECRDPDHCKCSNYSKNVPAYWRNARKIFGAALKFTGSEYLRERMDQATYSFCTPFRTKKFPQRKAERDPLLDASRPFLQSLFEYCEPKVVITAGVMARKFLLDATNRTCRGFNNQSLERFWQCGNGRFDPPNDGILVQIPHLSRASSETRQVEVGKWLAAELRKASI